jgi:hypothetical protein
MVDIKTLRIVLSVYNVVVCHTHAPTPDLKTPGINVIEIAMIHTHGVIWGSAGAA